MRDDLWKLINERDTAGLSDEQRAAIKADIESDSDALMRQCAERKVEREAERKANAWRVDGVPNRAKHREYMREYNARKRAEAKDE